MSQLKSGDLKFLLAPKHELFIIQKRGFSYLNGKVLSDKELANYRVWHKIITHKIP